MTKEEILAMFCAKSDIRVHLLRPQLIGDFVYASNGHWIVRMPASEVSAEPCDYDKFAESVHGVFAKAQQENFQPLPPQPSLPTCLQCKGTGYGLGGDCEACDGDGEFKHYGHWYDCQSCDGDGNDWKFVTGGKDPCPYCEGFGIVAGPTHELKFGDTVFATRYLHLLSKLPGIEIATAGPEAASRFRFDGGEGLLMPIRALEPA